ncbi:glycosyl transferase family 51 [Loktanella sp. IMCC34160]|uniref:transglycosylase domain-containing protein n=1 Tax=Loktanella sp. IMCC34160 TaxID=2510646 RepID=UPI00101DF4D5|nr:transglycosylase domain-containing protein [Loktanella sp. IMCC34160]RYG92324.1 glycosyl transferase family 51 [Loktanella sp. IMCC34160]
MVRVFWVLVAGFCALMVFEGWRLFQASARTDDLFAPYRSADYAGPRWDDLPTTQLSAWIAVEDPSFFSHPGVDLKTGGAGLTTITQALVKRMYFDEFRPGFSKLEQTLIAALVVNPRIPKEVQLTAALDRMYFGTVEGVEIIGFDNAAREFFGRPLLDLTDGEFIALVATLIGPDRFRPGSAEHDTRLTRIRRLLSGDCQPAGVRDVYLSDCDA